MALRFARRAAQTAAATCSQARGSGLDRAGEVDDAGFDARGVVTGSRAGRGAACGNRAITASFPAAGGVVLLGGADRVRSRAADALFAWDGSQPLGPSSRKAERGLIRRGVVVPATALATALSNRAISATVSSHLCETTTRAAISFAGGQSTGPLAVSLACEVLRSMMFNKLKVISLTLLLLGAVATSAGYLSRALAQNNDPKPSAASQQTPDDPHLKPAPGRMFVVGRVLDPQGKPVPGATVTASARDKFSETVIALTRPFLTEIGHVNADGSGKFRVDAPRTSSSRNGAFMAIALAPGFGLGWVKIDPDAGQPAADITLQSEQVIQGRLFDVQGRPAAGVAVSVSSIEREVVHDSGSPHFPGLYDGPIYEWTRVIDVPAWPRPATTDGEGRFTIHGVGRRLKAGLSIIDPRFALDNIDVETDNAPGAKIVTAALEPAKIFTGHVTDGETGKPVPHAKLRFLANATVRQRNSYRLTRFQADADGRFRANPSRGESFIIIANPPDGKIYLETRKTVDWPKGAVEQSADLALERGATIRGTVVEEGSGQPVAGATVGFTTLSRADVNRPGQVSATVTAADGSFELAVFPRGVIWRSTPRATITLSA